MEGLTQNEKNVWSCWETKTPRDVVREAASKGTHVALAYKYLQYKQNWDLEIAEQWFLAEVYAWVLQLLSRKQYFKASHVLTKINVPAHKHFFNLARESLDNSLRDYIIEQLTKTGAGLQKEIPEEWKVLVDHWELLKLLEQSFQRGILVQNKAFGIGKDMIVISLNEVKQLTIEKIQQYSVLWKNKIAAYLFLEVLDFSLYSFLDPELLWKILIQENRALILKRWITIFYTKEKNIQNDCLLADISLLRIDLQYLESPETLKQLDNLFLNWTITKVMIEYVSECKCFEFTKLTIYDTLLSFGHIVDTERNDLHAILNRLLRTQNIGNVDKILSRTVSTVSKLEFNNMIAEYCVANNQFHVMASCVDDKVLRRKSDTYLQTNNCLDLWLLLKETLAEKESNKYTCCIYETCRHLSTDISENPLIILSMLMLDKTKTVFDIFNEEKMVQFQNFSIEWKESLKHKLPHLHSVYQRWKNNTLIIENDINIYQMISGYKGLDISKIYEFQLINKCVKSKKASSSILSDDQSLSSSSEVIYSGESLNSYEEIPHFSNRQLVKKYGYQKQLNYVYYLKQNRPCMASQTLLTYQYQHFSRLNSKIIKEACSLAHMRALENWNDAIVTACCISFISMIGCNSIKCRTHIATANLIVSYLEQSGNLTKGESINKVNKLMEQLSVNNTEVIIEIYNLLENAVSAIIIRHNEFNGFKNIDVGKIIYEWQTVIKFASIHNLSLPEIPLKNFVAAGNYIQFLLFADLFQYPQSTLLALSREFSSQSISEHVGHAIMHQGLEELGNVASSRSKKEELRKVSRESSLETSTIDVKENSIDFSTMQDLWEVMAVCHGPDDPPGALIRASAALHCPLLALLATCYEPNAVDICWTQWLLSTLKRRKPSLSVTMDQWDPTDIMLSDKHINEVMEMCLDAGLYKTLHESITIFYKESPLCILTEFLIKTIVNFDFGKESVELLQSFENICSRRVSIVGGSDGSWLPPLQRPRFVQSISINLIRMALSKGFRSCWHKKEFLRCLCEVKGFSKYFTDDSIDFPKLYLMLDISMECKIPLDLGYIFAKDANEKLYSYIEKLLENKLYTEALRFADASNLPIEDILIADWQERYNSCFNENETTSQNSNKTTVLLFWTECSKHFLKVGMKPRKAIEFLKKQADEIPEFATRFYILRLILGWFGKPFEDIFNDANAKRDTIEFEMWKAYLSCDETEKIYLTSYETTHEYILNNNFSMDEESSSFGAPGSNAGRLFKKLLSEIEEEANICNMSITESNLAMIEADRWQRAISKLLDAGLVTEAWRLNKMFSAPPGYSGRPVCSLQIVQTSLQLAEKKISLLEIPQNLRIIVMSSSSRSRLSNSQCSDASFEEVVSMRDKQQEGVQEEAPTYAVERQEADCLTALEALGARSESKIVKQVANYFRISLQIGWSYKRVLKYEGNPIDLINCITGHGRMSLAKIIFKTFDIPPEKIIEYLCLEIVTSVVSPHLPRASGFRQKEHFHYTLWGYALDSDFEMFLNLRPDDNSILGRMLLEHLGAFRKCYRADVNKAEISMNDEEYDGGSEHNQDNMAGCDVESLAESHISGHNRQFSENQSTTSILSKIPRYFWKTARERKPQLDVISCINMQIKSSVKENMKAILKESKLSGKQVNVISIELLVLAHESFSSVCDTEGIATILRSAQTLTGQLLASCSWRLMVRLLTGLARYTELAYIFQILKDNHQFEFLLGQFDYMLGQHKDKINNFKQGILEYLNRHCSEDTDMYHMVALHFSMYSEAADLKRKHADNLIVMLVQVALDSMKVLKKKSTQQPKWIILVNNDHNRNLLNIAIDHCSDAAELYFKCGSLGAAREMAGLAQLLSLQVALLANPPTKCILKLTQEKMLTIVDTYLSFMEGLIFAHATDEGGGGRITKWREQVYQRALRGNDHTFISDIATCRPDIALYILERFENEKPATKQGQEAMAELCAFFK